MNKLSLQGIWKLRGEFLDVGPERWMEVATRADGEFTVSHELPPNVFPLRKGFLTANVPCDVITPLVEHGILKEPFDRTNTDDCTWTRDLSWWFIRDFTVDEAMLRHEEVRLFIEMLDFKADIILNGIPVASHRNTFVPFCEDVKRYLHPGENQIIIRLTNGGEDFYRKDSVSYYSGRVGTDCDQRVYLRKPQYTYGWDWCPPVPTCGIGRDLYLEGISGSKITAFRADTLACNNDSASLRLFFEVDNVRMYSADDAVLSYRIWEGERLAAEGKKDLYLCGGLNFIEEMVTMEHPRLWWPNGYGEAYLYRAEAEIVCRGQKNTMPEKRIGIRTITLDHSKLEDGTRKYGFVVNGIPVWCKGGNWVPTDSVYLRTPESTYRTLVREAAEANFTMLRMWGGGTYEPDCFYEECSARGILLMHDFMYACAFYPDDREWFCTQAALEADYQTKRLAQYACMAIWTGNNEIHESYTDWFSEEVTPERLPGAKIFNYIQPAAVARNAPMTPYAPSSPFFAEHANDQEAGDSHVWKWMGKDEYTRMKFHYELEAFDRLTTRFSSEFGFFGALMKSSVERYHDGEEVRADGEIWKHHGEYERKRRAIDDAIDRHLTDFSEIGEDVGSYLLYSGMMQGFLYEDMVHTLRARESCSGNLIWMYNDCWPETGWTVIDYYLTRKVSFYYLKRAYAPRKLIIKVADGKGSITVINETAEPQALTLQYGYVRFDGEGRREERCTLNLEAHSREVIRFEAADSITEGCYYAQADDSRFLPAASVRPYLRNLTLPVPEAAVTGIEVQDGQTIMTIEAGTYVPVVYLSCNDDRTHLSDNYFPMLPGERRSILVESTQPPKLHLPEFLPVPGE